MDKIQKKVLIIEDDQSLSKVYEIQFAKEGILSTLARDGDEAIKIIGNQEFDLVILDLLLPKKDGFEVLEEIKKNPKYSKIPTIIVSNLGQKDDEKRALELGATEYLIKVDHPIQDIIGKIKVYLQT